MTLDSLTLRTGPANVTWYLAECRHPALQSYKNSEVIAGEGRAGLEPSPLPSALFLLPQRTSSCGFCKLCSEGRASCHSP
jgi:hypothetical protein